MRQRNSQERTIPGRMTCTEKHFVRMDKKWGHRAMCELKQKAKQIRMKKESSLEKGHLLANACMMFIYHFSRVWSTRENIPDQNWRPLIVPYDDFYRQSAPNMVNLYSLTGSQRVFHHQFTIEDKHWCRFQEELGILNFTSLLRRKNTNLLWICDCEFAEMTMAFVFQKSLSIAIKVQVIFLHKFQKPNCIC